MKCKILGNYESQIDYSDSSDFNFWIPFVFSQDVNEQIIKECELSEFLKKQVTQNNFEDKSVSVLHKCLDAISLNCLSYSNQVLFLKVLSKLSTYKISADIIQSTDLLDWVEKQAHSESPKLYLEAWKIIHNLNSRNKNCIFLEGIYSFTPPWNKQAECDLVFVHGIRGGAAWTWRQEDSQREKLDLDNAESTGKSAYSWVWPIDWLTARARRPLRVIAVDYAARWWHWQSKSENDELAYTEPDFDSLCAGLLRQLQSAGVGSRPIIWVAHSMGGILVKRLLQMEQANSSPSSPSLCRATRGVVFLSVPHRGSPLASWSCHFAPLFRPSAFIYQMQTGSPMLIGVHDFFVDFCASNNVQVLSLNETKRCRVAKNGPSFIFVPPSSGDPGVGKSFDVDASHLDICKPTGIEDEKYKLIEDFVSKILEAIPFCGA